MLYLRRKLRALLLTIPILALSGYPIRLTAGSPFPPRGDDFTTSLGQFKIVVDPHWADALKNNPAYKPYVKSSGNNVTLTSPILFDPTTTIGRSDPLIAGSAADDAGVVTGLRAPRLTLDSQLTVRPTTGEGPPGTREVHTFIASLNLSAAGFSVKAGDQAPARPISAGEVESLSGSSGIPANDFPASSFFDVFVEVNVPGLGGFPNFQLVNVDALLVQTTNIDSFPPRVVYFHGNSSAVSIYFNTDVPALGVSRGDLFGQLTLAGHGVGKTEADTPEFQREVETESDLPLQQSPIAHVTVVDQPPVLPLPGDVTASVTLAKSGYRYNRGTHRFVQNVALRNVGAAAIAGPVSLVMDNLSPNAALFGPTGVTSVLTPLGSAYLDLDLGPSGDLAAGQTVRVTLLFSNPTLQGITYTTRVLAGSGSR